VSSRGKTYVSCLSEEIVEGMEPEKELDEKLRYLVRRRKSGTFRHRNRDRDRDGDD
jgi:hypothetical protein